MKATDSNFHNRFSNTLEYLGQAKIALDNAIKDFKSKYFVEMEHQIKISVDKLKLLNPINFFLHALFANCGFDNVKDLNQILMHNQEKQLFSNTHRLIKNPISLACFLRKEKIFTKPTLSNKILRKFKFQ